MSVEILAPVVECLTANQIDTTKYFKTLDKKLMMGYQGWFACPGDGSDLNCWWHWTRDNALPTDTNLAVDMWPNVTEVEELFPTGMTTSNDTRSKLYSTYNSRTVDLHFKWMKDYDLDGVMLQRFVCDLHEKTSPYRAFRDKVALNVMESAVRYGRPFCVMYDISDSKEDEFVQDLKDDWTHLVDDLKITANTSYLNHKDKPLLAIWGLGFKTRRGTASQASEIIAHFQNKAQVTLLGGVPSNWRTPGNPSDGDSKTVDPQMQPGDPTWIDIYKSFDVLSPWTVGDTGADDKLERIKDDLKYLKDLKDQSGREIDYMPVVFPGYSFKNAGQNEQPNTDFMLNRIPRDGGRFWWKQVYNAVNAGCTMIYGAMFDEVNEGTAMFKLVANNQDLPKEAKDRLVCLNRDSDTLRGELRDLESDWYLWLAQQGTLMLRGQIEATIDMPTRYQPPPKPPWLSRVLSRMKLRS